MIKTSITALAAAILVLGSASAGHAQSSLPELPAASQTEEQKQEEKKAAETKATALLDQVISGGQMLRLPANRIRIQIAAADLLWKRDESRARSLLSLAAEGVLEMMRANDRNAERWVNQLRQEVVLTAAQHDASLAYQLLAATRPLTTPSNAIDNPRRGNFAPSLEDSLLARVAELDPKLAAQKIEEALAKGQYPNTLSQVLTQLSPQDKEAASKLTAKVVSKLQSENMLTNVQAQALAFNLLRSGPKLAESGGTTSAILPEANTARMAVLPESTYKGLLETVIDAALKLPAQTLPGNQRRLSPRGRSFGAAQNPNQTSPESQNEQMNARRLIAGVQMLLPQIDQYAPARASAVRSKLTEMGLNTPQTNYAEFGRMMRQGTSETLISAALSASPQMQPRIYEQAAYKALEEGNLERAREIANGRLDGTTRSAVLRRIDFQTTAKTVEAGNMEQLQQSVAALSSDDERIDLLLQMAAQVQKPNGVQPQAPTDDETKQVLKVLQEAQRLVSKRASNYRQLDQQLRVAAAFAKLEPARSFEILDAGIAQLNELLSAAALLNGFEVNVFEDGELPLEGGSSLGSMISGYGRQLGALAKIDPARAEVSANKFQLTEPRLLSQLAIVRSLLGVPQASSRIGAFERRRGFGRRGQ